MQFDNDIFVNNEIDVILNFYRNSFSKSYKCVLQLQLLWHTITCFAKDLDRLCSFHCIDIQDKHKQVAHLIYWIVKIKPIHIIDGKGNFDRLSVPFINEIFACYIGLTRLGIDVMSISNIFLKNFLYMLNFREIKPEPLYLFLYTLEKACMKEIP